MLGTKWNFDPSPIKLDIALTIMLMLLVV